MMKLCICMAHGLNALKVDRHLMKHTIESSKWENKEMNFFQKIWEPWNKRICEGNFICCRSFHMDYL